LEALQRGEGGPAPNGAPSPSRGATRARPSPFIGARKVRPLVGAAELAALQVEDEVVVASSPLAPTQVEQEEGLRVLADLSDSELGKLCRGQVPHVQRELERQLVARAQQRKKVYEEAAQQGRRKAAHFRRRVELKLLKEAGAQGPTETGVFEPFQRRAERLNT
ncbi:DEAD-box ATP-dependent RNA helicase 35, partial [Durusdinium trenchii]